MTGTLHVDIDPNGSNVAEAIRAAARGGPLLILTGRLLDDLADELGTHEDAAAFLIEVATDVGRPIGINVDRGDGASTTAFLAPRSWTQERLSGWVAGHHETLGDLFGDVSVREGM